MECLCVIVLEPLEGAVCFPNSFLLPRLRLLVTEKCFNPGERRECVMKDGRAPDSAFELRYFRHRNDPPGGCDYAPGHSLLRESDALGRALGQPGSSPLGTA